MARPKGPATTRISLDVPLDVKAEIRRLRDSRGHASLTETIRSAIRVLAWLDEQEEESRKVGYLDGNGEFHEIIIMV